MRQSGVSNGRVTVRLLDVLYVDVRQIWTVWCIYESLKLLYRGADKSLARPDKKKKKLKGRHFSSDAEVIAAAETWLDGQPSELFSSGL